MTSRGVDLPWDVVRLGSIGDAGASSRWGVGRIFQGRLACVPFGGITSRSAIVATEGRLVSHDGLLKL